MHAHRHMGLQGSPANDNDSAQFAATHFEWEDTACLLCGENSAELIAEACDPLDANGRGLRFAVVRCRHCGLAFTNPRPKAEHIGSFYPPGYSPHGAKSEQNKHRIPSRLRCRLLGTPCRERRGAIPVRVPGRLLDFGCGGGSYLTRMAGLGWEVTGVDASPIAVQRVEDELGYPAHLGTLPNANLMPGSFEAITMWQSLEHVHQPLEVLRAAFRLLVPGGALVIAVPNFDTPARSWFGDRWHGYDLPRHLSHFTPATLGAMIQASGFQLDGVRGLAHSGWLQTSAKRAFRGGISLGTRLLKWRPATRAVAWATYTIGRADCLVAVAHRPA